jgi:hypothetical protein
MSECTECSGMSPCCGYEDKTPEYWFKLGFDTAWNETGEGFNGEYARFRYTTYDGLKQSKWDEIKKGKLSE